MLIVGLTGSIASGKSTVSRMFQDLGAYVIDWDVLAREVVNPHMKAWEETIEQFGPQILNEDETLDRQKLGGIVFNDADKLETLNQIVHPAICEEDRRREKEIRERDPEAIIIKDVPLLIEVGHQGTVDKVIVVYASEDNQLARVMERGFDLEESGKRIHAQMPLDKKIAYADFVIRNDGSLEETQRQVKRIYDELKRLAASR